VIGILCIGGPWSGRRVDNYEHAFERGRLHVPEDMVYEFQTYPPKPEPPRVFNYRRCVLTVGGEPHRYWIPCDVPQEGQALYVLHALEAGLEDSRKARK
jgi:hypothetical protein